MVIPAARVTREELGIPADAKRVLVFTESSHWDTNWLSTSEEYFHRRVEPIIVKVIDALQKEPSRVYSIESVFFLELFWERHPELHDTLRELVDSRRLRLMSSAFTTPDTLLPPTEAILRDFHLGQLWLDSVGLPAHPRTAYFPDNFGHSPHLPSLMRVVGVESVALTRIDGMYFIAADYRRKGSFPLAGSTADMLQNKLKSLDFVWRDDDGAEVLCHWNAFTYFQGDMLAHLGVVRWNGIVAALPWRTSSHVARQIDGFVRQLEPLARTPILLCPIGMDFNDPIVGLRGLLDRYNREAYPTSGTWTVLTGLDDYFDMLRAHAEKLPVLSVDPNPYWMGFYSSRPELKQRPARISRSLLLAESLSAIDPISHELEGTLRDGWSSLVLVNHHDAITGTSPDHVWHGEQKSWLDVAESAAAQAVTFAMRAHPPVAAAPEEVHRIGPVVRSRDEVRITTDHHRLTFSKARGGCLTSLVADGQEILGGVGMDLVAFADEGGLWRLGHEYQGGQFEEIERASRRRANIEVRESPDAVIAIVTSELRGKTFRRIVTCSRSAGFLNLRVEGFAARRLTVTCRFEVAIDAVDLEMDTVGGTIVRPHERLHRPTFWPVPSLVSLREASCPYALHASFEAPTAVSLSPLRELEWIVARNPIKERAFGLLPVLAHPIGGTVDELQTHRAALFVTEPGRMAASVARELELAWFPPELRETKRYADSLVRCDDPEVSVLAIKRADVGPGIIVRLATRDPRTVHVTFARPVVSATLCDAREVDQTPLEVRDGGVVVALQFRLTTLRIVVG